MHDAPLLLIEDDSAIIETLTDILESQGYSITAVRTVAEALSLTTEFSVALLDIALPDGSGLDVARNLRKRQTDIDLVFVTAQASLATAIDAIELGAVRYLQKPCPPQVLLRTIEELHELRNFREEVDRQTLRVTAVNNLLGQLIATMNHHESLIIGVKAIHEALDCHVAAILLSPLDEQILSRQSGPIGVAPEALAELSWLKELSKNANQRSFSQLNDDHGGAFYLALDMPATNWQGILLIEKCANVDIHLAETMGVQLAGAIHRALLHSKLTLAYAELKDTHKTLLETEKQSAVGRVTAGIAHEIGTPLNIIQGRAEVLLARAETNSSAATGLQIITQQTERITQLIRQLLDYSRNEDTSSDFNLIQFSAVLAETLPLLQTHAMNEQVSMKTQIPEGLKPIRGNFHQLQQVVLNLLLNAVDAGADEIEIELSEKGSDEMLYVSVSDNGHGIEDHSLEKVFEPFFTTKLRGEGTGLGLAVVRNIIMDHQGHIHAERRESHGTRIIFTLPNRL